MKAKTLGILVGLAVVLGVAWFFVYRSSTAAYSRTGGGGGKVVDFDLNAPKRIQIKSAEGEVNLVVKNDVWTVQERQDYPANFEQVSSTLRKLNELKTVQEVKVGPSQMPRLELVEPGKGEKTGTLVQLQGADGKTLAGLLLGKKQMRNAGGGEDMGMPGGGGFATGRYVKPLSGEKVSLVSETFESLEPKPERWLEKDFVKIEGPKAITVAGPDDAHRWSVTRESTSGDWKLADAKGDEKPDPGKTSSLGTVFSSPSFNDVLAPDAKVEEPFTNATVETFDGFKYELKIGKAIQDSYPVFVKVSANFPKERTPGKDEKPEDKERLDKEFAEKQKKNQEKLAEEKKFEGRAYLVPKYTADPLLKDRAGLLPDKPATPPPATPAAPGAAPSTGTASTPPVPAPAPAPGASAASQPVTATTPPMTAPAAPAPSTPAPKPAATPAPSTPAPATPAPKPAATPSPSTPAPTTPAPPAATPTPSTPAPPAPATPAPKPATPAPATPAPTAATPPPPAPAPAPATPAPIPATPAPDKAKSTPAPATPVATPAAAPSAPAPKQP